MSTETRLRKWEQPDFFRTPTSLDDAKAQLRKEKKYLKRAQAELSEAIPEAEKAQYFIGVKIAQDEVALRSASVAHFESWIQSHTPSKTTHHATKKSSAAKRFTLGDPNRDDYLRYLDDTNDPPRTKLQREAKLDREIAEALASDTSGLRPLRG